MSTSSAGQGVVPSPGRMLLLGTAVALLGLLTIMAASVDPWLLVMLAGVVVTVVTVYDRTEPGWLRI